MTFALPRLRPCRCLLTIAIVCVVFLPSAADAEATKIKDLEFASPDGHSLKLDLYLSPQPDSPLLVWIHGGGWRAGSKARCPVSWLTDEGFAVASISYRLTDKGTFPDQIHDCKAAVRWLRANADKYDYSVDRIAVAGSSAGGHLSALLGTTGGVKVLEGNVGGNEDQSSRVDAIVDFFGPTDFVHRTKTQPHKTTEKGSPVSLLLGGPADKKVKAAKLASPIHHVSADDPPLLIFHGTDDTTVLIAQSDRFADAYRKAGLSVRCEKLDGAKHGGAVFYSGEQRKTLTEFLNKHLR